PPAMSSVPRSRGVSHVPAMPRSVENTPCTCRRAGVTASSTDRSTLSAVARTESVSGSWRRATGTSERSSGRCACTVRICCPDRQRLSPASSRRARYSNAPSTNGARNSPSDPLVSENVPVDTGSARVPARAAVAVIAPPTPAVSPSSSAYTPASGNDSSWRFASARAREPGERVARAAYRRCGGAETQHAMREGIERRFELEHRHRAWPIGEPHAPPRYRPAAPLQALDAGAGLEPERVERALQADEHARRARKGPAAGVARVAIRSPVAAPGRDPAQQRIERVQAVGVEVERQCAAVPVPPAQRARARGDQAGLREPQRVDVEVARGERPAELHPSRDRAAQRQGGETPLETVERQRVGRQVRVHAERVAAAVEPHRPGKPGRRPRAVTVLERAGELHVPQRSIESP